jgi:uncharacterized iron-regulated protein
MTNCPLVKFQAKFHLKFQFWAWSLGLALLGTWPAYAQMPLPALTASQVSVSSPQKPNYDPQAVLTQLAQVSVVYLGETHDSPDDHHAQLEIIQSLHRFNPNLAIAMEMFQRPYQSVIDRYLSGEITETQLQELSQYPKRWGFPWEYYAPILRFAKANRLPVIALNTPSEVTRKVARGGLKSLTLSDRRFIPPISEIRAEPAAYRERMRQIYEDIHQGKGRSDLFELFFLAQILWDETMADRISQFLKATPNTQVIVLAGQGHLIYGDGIPSRVARRMLNKPQFSQSLVLLNPPAEFTTKQARPIADFFWNLRSTP